MKRLLNLAWVACLCHGLWGSAPDGADPELEAAEFMFAGESAPADVNGPIVRTDFDGNVSVAPWFQAIQPDLLRLIKLSYSRTERDAANVFRNGTQMLSRSQLIMPETGHEWLVDRNFTGTHGSIERTSFVRRMLNRGLEFVTGGAFSAEVDFPGFVALMNPNDDCPYYVVAVVFRGSQGEDFQPGSGLLSASWATNYDVAPLEVGEEEFGFPGRMHAGYTTKVLSCDLPWTELIQMVADGEVRDPLPDLGLNYIYPLERAIVQAVGQIPAEERGKIRFVVTGHSQGGGLAQVALPRILHIFGHTLRCLPGFVDNIQTPRFFGYFLSAPRVAADQETVDAYDAFVGRDNMVNHFAFRDIVTMACLHGYLPLGHLACDAAYDVFYRAIASECAHNNQLLLMRFFRCHLDPERFDAADEHHWIYKENPNLIICWKEIRRILSRERLGADHVTREGLLDVLNRALGMYRQQNGIESNEEFGEEHTLLADELDWERIRGICRGDLQPGEIELDQERRNILRRIEENMSGETVSFSRDGHFNVLALLDTAFDLMDAPRDTRNRGGCMECLKRLFCCSCCCSRSLQASHSFFFDPNFQELVAEDYVDPDEYGISPAGAIPVFAYLHYGSSANSRGKQLFDPFLPSRNLNHALANGKILLDGDEVVLQSELWVPEEAAEEARAIDETGIPVGSNLDAERPSAILRMRLH
ncbi:MAG: hypothetical protein LBG09_01440 [Puniceicoccales bacterium]|jgi:hypothetical protein|nr:hypothetical protein [Puniceicoccales bacterium]